MSNAWALTACVTALALCAALLPPLIARLRRAGLLDVPNDRSSHHSATPRGGGLAVVVAALAATLIAPSRHAGLTLVAVFVVVIGFAAVGLADDLRGGISPRMRFGVCITTAVGGSAVLLHQSHWGFAALPLALLAGLWIVAYTNAFNFMDGINGISAIQLVVAGGFLWYFGATEGLPVVVGLSAALMGAALAFLPFNAIRNSVFLGDVGSYGAGAAVAALVVVVVAEGVSPFVAAAFCLPYAADTATTLVRRVRRHEAWWEPHRQHAYQRLTDLGWSQLTVAVFVGAMSTCCGLIGVAGAGSNVGRQLVLLVVAAALAAAYALVPEWAHRRTSDIIDLTDEAARVSAPADARGRGLRAPTPPRLRRGSA